MSSNNMYRVGDFVYFESSAGVPYQIRKIEELNKTTTGAVEAKVICFHRRRDDPVHELLPQINEDYGLSKNIEERKLHMLKHRELFLTRQLETLPATHIRGKANVVNLNDKEELLDILTNDNCFFYKYVFDHAQKTLHTGNSSIRIGPQYQAQIPDKIEDIPAEEYYKSTKTRETPLWSAEQCNLSKNQLENLMLISRSLTIYSKAFDVNSVVKQPALADATLVSKRDHYKIFCLNLLHQCNYDMVDTINRLTPGNCPLILRDEMEAWSSTDAKAFEDGMAKYGKVFHLLQKEMCTKTTKQIVEFYYFWKTSNIYASMKDIKKMELEHKLKQVYIPNYTKPNPAVLYNESTLSDPSQTSTNTGGPNSASTANQQGCESCGNTSSEQWFVWGTLNCPCKLCDCCWSYWKRYGGLKNPNTQDKQQARELDLKSNVAGTQAFSVSPNLTSNGIPASNNAATVASSNNFTNSYMSKNLHTITTANTHQYQCPQIGCDKLLRQAPQMHAHVISAHPDLLETLGGDQQLLTTMEEFRNQKIGFVMQSSPELRAARRLMRTRLHSNTRLSRCFRNRETRVHVAVASLTRFQLHAMFNKFLLDADSDTRYKIELLISEKKVNKRQYASGVELLHDTIDRIKTKKTSINGITSSAHFVQLKEENGV